jgi:hypothetical protein
MVTLGMFLKRSPIVCVRRKLHVADGILEAAPTLPKPEWAIKKSGSALCKTTTRTLSSASSCLPSLSNSCDRTSSRKVYRRVIDADKCDSRIKPEPETLVIRVLHSQQSLIAARQLDISPE